MDLYMFHGRTDPNGGPETKTVNSDGTIDYCAVDDWGFDGPRLKGVVGFHCTYGHSGNFNVYFESNDAMRIAHALTGWSIWCDDALTADFEPDGTLLKIAPEGGTIEYFGDWGII